MKFDMKIDRLQWERDQLKQALERIARFEFPRDQQLHALWYMDIAKEALRKVEEE